MLHDAEDGYLMKACMPLRKISVTIAVISIMSMASSTWRFTGSYRWVCKSPNTGYKYSYPAYNPTYIYP